MEKIQKGIKTGDAKMKLVFKGQQFLKNNKNNLIYAQK